MPFPTDESNKIDARGGLLVAAAAVLLLVLVLALALSGCAADQHNAKEHNGPAVWSVNCILPDWRERPDPAPLPKPNSKAAYYMADDTPWDALD